MTEKRTDTEDDVESDKTLDERIAEALSGREPKRRRGRRRFLDVAAHPPLGRQLGRTALPAAILRVFSDRHQNKWLKFTASSIGRITTPIMELGCRRSSLAISSRASEMAGKQPRVQLNILPGEKFVIRHEDNWPLPSTKWAKFHLAESGQRFPGCGPFLHVPARPPDGIYGGKTTIYLGGGRDNFVLLPIIPHKASPASTGKSKAGKRPKRKMAPTKSRR